MSIQFQLRRGTSTQFATFTGALGEVTYNTTAGSIRVHDGSTVGGIEMLRLDLANIGGSIPNTALSHSTISGVALGSNLNALTIGTGLSGTSYNGTTGVTIALAASGVTAGSYGSSTAVPVITFDTYGRATSVSTASISSAISFTGDVTGSGTTGSSTALTLATVNSNVGSFGSASTTLSATVNAKGLITAISSQAIAIANTQVSGLGTMSTQSASSVNITGGTINGTAIGGTTPAAIAGTTITGTTLTSTVATGSAPLVVTSTTPVANLSIGAGGSYQGNVISGTYGGTGVNNGSNTLTLAGNVTHAGSFTQTFTATANTSLTLPTTGTLATLAGAETFTNKTISGLTNTFTSIPNSSLSNSSVTIGSTNVALGATSTSISGLTAIDGTSGATSFFATPTSPTLFAAGTSINIGASTGTTTVNNNMVVTGNFTVNGTTETINSTTMVVADKNIEIGKVGTPTDTTANGGGILLYGSTNKTFQWASSTSAWTSSENIALAAGKSQLFNGSTSGTITLTSAAIAGTNTITLPATTGTVVTTGDTGTVTNTMLAGSIANSKLTNSSVTIGSTNVALGATVTTFAGLTSVTSTTFVGALTGNASTATTLQTPRNINGVAFDGSANIIIAASTTNALTIGTGLTGTSFNGSSAVTVALASSGVTAGSYGSATAIPVLSIDQYGRITSASTIALSSTIAFSGDVTGSGTTGTTTAMTLATVNTNVGSFGSTTQIPVVTVNAKGLVTAVSTASISGAITLSGDATGTGTTGGTTTVTLASVGTAGTYTKITTNSKGLVTAGSNATTDDIAQGSSNLYFSVPLARASISASGIASYNSSTGVINVNNPTLQSLSGVNISSPAANQVLTYTGSAWINAASNATVASAIFATSASDLGYVTDNNITITEDEGTVYSTANNIYDCGILSFTGIISLNNIDQSVKSDYLAQALIFGF